MADKNKKSNSEKALGQDPFEGLFGPEWDEITKETTSTEPTTEADQSTQSSEEPDELEPELETTTKNGAEVDQAFEALTAPGEPAAETEPVDIAEVEDAQAPEAIDAEDELEPEFKAIAEINAAEIDQALEALGVAYEPRVEIEPVALVEDEGDQVTEASETTEEPEVEIEPVAAVESENDQDTEPSDAEEVKENLVFEEAPGVLDEIIASIDEEIEQSHEADLMAALQTEASGSRNENLEQYIIFTLAGAMYAAPAANVREVGEMASLTPVPNVPDWLMGVTNLRGDVLSVVDLHTFLSLEQSDYIGSLSQGDVSFSGEHEVLVVHPREDASLITTGLVVDEVNDIRYLAADRITAPAAPIEDQVGSYLRGVYEDEDHLLVVLDFERLLLSPEMQQFELL